VCICIKISDILKVAGILKSKEEPKSLILADPGNC
jgi:hypothetical protein